MIVVADAHVLPVEGRRMWGNGGRPTRAGVGGCCVARWRGRCLHGLGLALDTQCKAYKGAGTCVAMSAMCDESFVASEFDLECTPKPWED